MLDNEVFKYMDADVIKILVAARRLEKWVSMELLVPYGMNREFVHALEDMHYINVTGHRDNPMIKLTAKGYKEATNN